MVTENHKHIKSVGNISHDSILTIQHHWNLKLLTKPFYVIYANLSTIRNLSTTSKHKPKKW